MSSTPRTLVVLGSGGSVGVPVIGCDCRVCTSTDPKDSRTRPSVLLQLPTGNLLIDTSPELRLQLVREKVPVAHAILYTHYHVDHLFGLDDVRIFPKRLGHAVPIYCNDEVEEVIRKTFSYAFHAPNRIDPAFTLPKLEFRRVTDEPLEILGLPITPIPLIHGRFHVYGYRFGDLAYVTDVSEIPERSWPLLQGLDTLFLDAVRPGASLPSHFGLDAALEVVGKLKPKRTYLTHLSHTMDPAVITLPPGVELAWDGLRVEF